MRRVIVDKAERLYRIPPAISADSFLLSRGQRFRRREIIDLGDVRSELFAHPDFSGEAGAILGSPALRRNAAVEELYTLYEKLSKFYRARHNIKLNPKTSFTLLSAGLPGELMLCQGLINPKDEVVITDPSSPVFMQAAVLASASVITIPASERTDYLPMPELPELEKHRKIKLKFINYPHNPTGAAADKSYFNRLIKTASEGDYLICHRAGFSGLNHDSTEHPSILESPGSRKTAVELIGFDLGFGLRNHHLQFAAGSPDAISVLNETNSLFGETAPYYLVRLMETALDYYDDALNKYTEIIKSNAELLSTGLRALGWKTFIFKGAPYIWAAHPRRTNSLNLAQAMFKRTGVLVQPGVRFGENGEGYLRFSLTAEKNELLEALERITRNFHPIQSGKKKISDIIREYRNGFAKD